MSADSSPHGRQAPTRDPVAIIGLGCVLPDANNVREFWQNIRSGRSSIREVPKDRWDPDLFWSPDRNAPDKTYTKIGAFVTGFKPDPMKFRIPPKVLQALDESQVWALEAAQQALTDAGYDKKPFDRTRCAVILGNAMGGETRLPTSIRLAFPLVQKALEQSPAFQAVSAPERGHMLKEMETRFKAQFPEITEDSMPGELSNVIAGRIANVLNLTGKNFTTDAACASSLAAIDAAVKALQYDECDLVLTGGADKSMDVGTYVKFCRIGALSPNGSFPFDARADGFVMGEGCVILLLKRLSDAVRDGDRVYAVLRGAGASSDGKGKGITAPNIEGQISCLERALADAGVPPGEIDLIECHGTSTKVGDVVEIEALTRIFGSHVPRTEKIPIGSVKSNLGHLKSAAGAVSLLKTALSLHEKILPPSIHFQTPNPNVKWDESPFRVNTATQPWPEPPLGRPRRAGVSSFGFGGTNFHVVLEEYAPAKAVPHAVPIPHVAPAPSGVSGVLLHATPRTRKVEPLHVQARMDVLVVGGATAPALEAEVRRVQEALRKRIDTKTFPAFLHAQNTPALSQHLRIALVVESPTDALEKLNQALEALYDAKKRPLLANKGIHFGEGNLPGKVAFLFPGQGSQYADMTRDLATRYVTVERTLEDADRVMEPLVSKPLTEFLFTDEGRGRHREAVEEALKRTEITQPAVLAADTALYRLLADYGIKPDMVAGHSLGEYGALIAAGVLTFEDALLAVSARGREMANVHVPDLGKMASVSADPATVEAKLKAVQGYVIPANKNCQVQTVIAGASDAVDRAVQLFQSQGIAAQLIPVSAAFHSAIVAPATEPMKRVLERLDVREPKIPILSNVHADYYPRGPAARQQAIELLGRQVASPVEWQRQIERMYTEGIRVFVEVGPKTVLTTFVKNILEGRAHWAVGTNHPKKGGFFHFLDAVALLAAHGYPVRFPRPEEPAIHLPAFREALAPSSAIPAQPPIEAKALTPSASAPKAPVPVTASAPNTSTVSALVFPNLERHAEEFIRAKQEELRRALLEQLNAAQPAPTAAVPAADAEMYALRKRVEALGLNLEPILITGLSVGTPGTSKKLFDDRNVERILEGENAIEPLLPETLEKQVEKNIVRLVKSETGDHRFETIRDVADVIKLAGRRGEFDLEGDYGVASDLAQALDITSKMAIAAGIEALRDAQIPLVRGYVKTTRGTFLPGEWALPEPLQHETGVIFASVWPGVPKIVEYVSRSVAHKYARKSLADLQSLYRELSAQIRDPEARRSLEQWVRTHEQELQNDPDALFEFNRRFLFHVLGMGHSQLAQFIRAKGPNTLINAACATTTQAVSIAEDWIRAGRCKRVLIVGADDVTGPEMIEYWASGFLAAGAATTEGDVTKAALPFDKRRHGMIIGMGAVGLVVEAESVVRDRGMEGIAEILATTTLNSAYHGSRLDTDHVAKVMDDLLAAVERRTGVPRGQIAERLLFMSHETYTPARGGSAAAEIEALTKTFGPHVSKVVVANTKGFTGHPMAVGIEDAIALRCLQLGRAPPIANLKEPDPSLGNIQLSRGGFYDLEYGLRLGAGFGSQIAMYVVKLRSKDLKRIIDPARYHAWVEHVSGTRNPELEVVHRTLRVKAQLPPLAVAEPAPVPLSAPPAPPMTRPPAPAPRPAAPIPAAVRGPTHEEVLERILQVVAEKTGYTRDLLDPDLDLEADLGIDTVKQAELFGLIREHYQLPREENLQLKDYSTLHKIAGYIVARAAAARSVSPSATAIVVAPPATPISPPPSISFAGIPRGQVLQRILDLVAEKTGYPRDLLDPDLELEADLGIDTVKQAEIFGLVRAEFNVPRDDSVQLRDYPTLNRMVDYLHARLGGSISTPTAPQVSAPIPTTPPPTIPPPSAASVSLAATDRAAVLARVRQVVSEKTGYPLDLLDPNLDLEADLGIDTVKQAELFGLVREEYGIARDDSIQLKDYNTLNKLADFIVQRAASSRPGGTLVPAPVSLGRTEVITDALKPIPAPRPAAVPATPQPSATAASKPMVLAGIRQMVADKTGYPLDLLDPELDLEADLGIDTVKQAELFGVVRESFGIPRMEDIQLKDYNTLNKLADFIVQQAGRTRQVEVLTVPSVETSAASPRSGKSSHRYLVRYVSAPAGASDPKALESRTLLVWAPPNLRSDLLQALEAAGAIGIPLEALPARLEDAMELMESERRKTPRLHGLLFVPTPNPTGSQFEPEDTRLVKSLFYLVKALLAGAQSGDVDRLAVATFLGGDFGLHRSQPLNPVEGALAGFAKAMARELPGARVKVVDFALRTPSATLAQTLVAELGQSDGLVEVGTQGGRGALRLLETETAEEEPGLDLSSRDVLLVSGGASGITPEILKAVARSTPASFVLLGRTSLDPRAGEYARFTPEAWNAKRAEIQTDLKARGERVTPVAVERALQALKKTAEVHTAVEALRAAGAHVEYHAIDVTDAKAVHHVVQGARTTLGPITGILHAAGVEESKLIVDKTSESFDRVFDVKVLGARNLLAATAEHPVRFFLAFTSIAGRFGNAGQADYSAANDALAKLCAALRQERGASWPATAIDWSAWDEKGMATRGSIMTVLKEAGVAPLSLQEGIQRFLEEAAHGCTEAEVVVAGPLGRLASPEVFTTREAAQAAPPVAVSAKPKPASSGSETPKAAAEEAGPARGLVTEPVRSDGRTATATLLLDPARDPYLRDHAVDGVPYLPGVFGLEAFAQVASSLALKHRFVGARDVEFRLPVKVLRDRPLEVTVVASVALETEERVEVGCRLQSVFTNAKGERLGAPRIHFTGTLLFEKASPSAPPGPGAGGDLDRIIEAKEIYRHYFHGPSFRVLDRVGLAENGADTLGLWADPRAPLFQERSHRFLTNPLMRELAYQTAGAHELFRNRWLALPKGEGRLTFYRDVPPSAAVRAHATFKKLEENVAHFDIVAATPEGAVLFAIEDFQLIRLRPLEGGSVAATEPAPRPVPAAAPPAASVQTTLLYKTRWGADVPLPKPGVVGIRVDERTLEAQGITDTESLTSGERQDQQHFNHAGRAREFFAGRLAAKEAIAILLGRPVREARGIEIRRLETGEPAPRGSGLESVLVSITHTGDVAFAVAGRRDRHLRTIGIDAERIELKPSAFETEAFTAAERALLEAQAASGVDRAELQVRFWAVKEAVLKALGKGFALDVQDVEVRGLDADEHVPVALAEPARSVLRDLGARAVTVQTWLRDGLAFALAWTHD